MIFRPSRVYQLMFNKHILCTRFPEGNIIFSKGHVMTIVVKVGYFSNKKKEKKRVLYCISGFILYDRNMKWGPWPPRPPSPPPLDPPL